MSLEHEVVSQEWKKLRTEDGGGGECFRTSMQFEIDPLLSVSCRLSGPAAGPAEGPGFQLGRSAKLHCAVFGTLDPSTH